jgi:hypothetical protein
MSISFPKSCPLCNGEWKELMRSEHYICPNPFNCHMVLMDHGKRFFLKKRLSNGTEVWWSHDGPSEVHYPHTGFKKLTFDPPYDVTLDRLKLFILFS